MSLDTGSERFRGCMSSFLTAYRTNSLPKEDLVKRRRENIDWFSSLRFKKVHDLREDQIADILSRCEVSYFIDRTGRYDDPAVSIIRDNPHVTVSSFLISMIRSGTISMADYDLEIKGMDGSVKTELVSMIAPCKFVPMDDFTLHTFEYLGICDLSDMFMSYMRFGISCKRILEELQRAGILRADLSTVTEFLYHCFDQF